MPSRRRETRSILLDGCREESLCFRGDDDLFGRIEGWVWKGIIMN